MTAFIYKGSLIETPNLEKKLKRMHLTLADVTIVDIEKYRSNLIKESNKIIEEESYELPILYRFQNKVTSEIIVSLYNNLTNLIWNPETKTGIKNFNPNLWKRV